jgi:hypothetical protein
VTGAFAMRTIAGAALAAVTTGALVLLLWTPVGLPAGGGSFDAPFPGLWRWFFAVVLPAMFALVTALHVRLVHWSDRAPSSARTALTWDRRSYALLPLFLLLMVAFRSHGGWRTVFGAFFVSVLFGKVLGLSLTLYRTSVHSGADSPGTGLLLTALILYGCLTIYVVTALSTAGDEHIYLLSVHSLYADHDLEIRNNVAREDFRDFYWGRPSPRTWQDRDFVAFPVLLFPAYVGAKTLLPEYPLAGRLGATLVISLCAALAGVQVYRLCRDLGGSPPAALWAWASVALTPPFLVSASHVYPEIPAALAAVWGVRALLRVPTRLWQGLAGMLSAVACIVLLKERYASIGFGMIVWTSVRLIRRQLTLATGLLAGMVGVGLWLALAKPFPAVFQTLAMPAHVRAAIVAWNQHMVAALIGLWADQQFGLLYYAPMFALTFIGIPLLWQRRSDVVLGLVGLVVLYLLVLVKFRWIQWDAGWTPPPRFMVTVVPLLAPLVAEVFDRARGPVLAMVNTLAWLWSGAVAFLLSVHPFWRYNQLNGRSTLLGLAGDALGLDLARFLPSLWAPNTWTPLGLIAGGAVLLIAAIWVSRRRGRAGEGWGIGAVVISPGRAVALVAGVVAIWVMAAALVPTTLLWAGAMHHAGGEPFGSLYNERSLWVMKQKAEIWEPIVTLPGVTEIRIRAGGYSTTEVNPRMTLLLGDQPVRTWDLEAGPGRWTEAEYTARVPTGLGRTTLRLRFGELGVKPIAGARDRIQLAYVERIWLRWRPGAA